MSKRILIVDDDAAFCEVLARSLERHQYQTRSAQSMKAALAACENFQPEQAIVDLKLGEDSGLQLIPQLRARFPKLKILMLTGYSSIATAVDAIKLGANNYLQKPAGAKEIIAALEEKSILTEGAEAAITPPSLERLEWEHIQRVLKENDDNVSATARQLGMHRRTLQRKLQKRPVKS